jgi:hypothetical protein
MRYTIILFGHVSYLDTIVPFYCEKIALDFRWRKVGGRWESQTLAHGQEDYHK